MGQLKIRVKRIVACVGFLTLAAEPASAALLEISPSFSFMRQNYSPESYSWSRRYSLGIGIDLTQFIGIEVYYQNGTTRTKITGYQDTTFYDKVYSINWVQGFLPRSFPVQPYVKLGFGQLNREATGSYAGGYAPPAVVDEVTVVVSAGVRVGVGRRLSLKVEGTSYLEKGAISTYKDNFALTAGFGLSL